ncbi:VOC family protein [Dactylosporangium sp. CA-233914]|uniref:VOC family protein n=1 Tax=Dactylosporangium sp. CA-233914 TaxID=3239934 RepID=UPI003D9008DE
MTLRWAGSGGAGATNAAPAGFVRTDPDAPVCVDVIAVPDPETVQYRVHLELATASAAHQAELVARLKGSVRRPPMWIILDDPEGNEFCV